jgi:hypothetical protein
MKLKDWIVAFVLTLIVILLYKYNTLALENQQQIDQLKQPQQIVKVEPIKVDVALVERLEELSRYVERLEMECAAQKDYIKGMGETWDDWASKNSFPGSEGENK